MWYFSMTKKPTNTKINQNHTLSVKQKTLVDNVYQAPYLFRQLTCLA